MRDKRTRKKILPTCEWCRCPLWASKPDTFVDHFIITGETVVTVRIHKECLPKFMDARKSA